MLVLSRKKNEVVHIGADIRVVVAAIRGDKVRLAIDAPTAVPVHRQEVFAAIQDKEAREKEVLDALCDGRLAELEDRFDAAENRGEGRGKGGE